MDNLIRYPHACKIDILNRSEYLDSYYLKELLYLIVTIFSSCVVKFGVRILMTYSEETQRRATDLSTVGVHLTGIHGRLNSPVIQFNPIKFDEVIN